MSNVSRKTLTWGILTIGSLAIAIAGIATPGNAKAQYEDNDSQSVAGQHLGNQSTTVTTSGVVHFTWQNRQMGPGVIINLDNNMNQPGSMMGNITARRLIILNTDDRRDYISITNTGVRTRAVNTAIVWVSNDFFSDLAGRLARDRDFDIELDTSDNTISFTRVGGNVVTDEARIILR